MPAKTWSVAFITKTLSVTYAISAINYINKLSCINDNRLRRVPSTRHAVPDSFTYAYAVSVHPTTIHYRIRQASLDWFRYIADLRRIETMSWSCSRAKHYCISHDARMQQHVSTQLLFDKWSKVHFVTPIYSWRLSNRWQYFGTRTAEIDSIVLRICGIGVLFYSYPIICSIYNKT